jgi:hypothetical protein
MKRHISLPAGCIALVAAMALVAGGCGAKSDSSTSSTEDGAKVTTTAAGASTVAKFGTLDSPCGKSLANGKKATVKASEAGTGTDKLYLSVANERSSTIRPGLLQEMWDTSVAFTKWCNDQGGIGGLPLEAVDADAKVLQVESAMATVCSKTFALVGGGWVQDQLVFSGKEGSDFHKCKMIAVPGFAVSAEFGEGNGSIQPLPHPAYLQNTNWIEQLVRLYPDKMKKSTVVWGNLPSMKANKDEVVATGKAVPGYGSVPDIQYDAVGQPDWSLVAQQVKDSGATSLAFVGEPQNLSSLSAALRAQSWDGVVFADANQYDQVLIDTSGPEAVEGVAARIAVHPIEEADKWPAVTQYLDIMKKDGPPNAKIADLGMQSMSAWLLFSTAAKACAESSGGEISRDCVLNEAFKISSWTGGGLHAETDPAGGKPNSCAMLMSVQKGKWARLDPKIDDAKAKDGFYCGKTVTVTGDFGKGNIDPTRTH